MTFEFHHDSLLCRYAKRSRFIRSSRALGWKSILVDHHEGADKGDAFETSATPDLTLVVAVRGRAAIDVFSQGRWRGAHYESGTAGITAPGETTRMRCGSLPGQEAFQSAQLYLPSRLVSSIAEEYRRVGTSTGERQLSARGFRDPVVASASAALLDAVTHEAPELYAEQLGNWLVTHILAQHAGWWNAAEDRRQAAVIPDRRLARVIEYMSVRLAEPLTMDALAREAGISVHHFSRRFREQTGFTPYDYLVRLRMEAAATFLRTSDLTIGEIAHACGYARPAAFAAAFLRHRGCSPTAYRAQNRRSSQNR